MDVTSITEMAIRNTSAREIVNILKMTGMYKPKPKPGKALILQVNPRFATDAVRSIRNEGIICLYEQYKHNGRFTVMKEDMKKIDFILNSKNVQYNVVNA